MGTGGVRIGGFAGAPIVLARSWFLVALVLTIVFQSTVERQLPALGLGSYLVAAAFVVLLMLSVLVHELAHAAAARAVGQPVTRIVLDLWGGHTQFGSDSVTPARSFAVAVVGPLANGVLAALAFALGQLLSPGTTASLLVTAFTLSNAFVAVFNLLPGIPLDGGRLLEAVVWRITGDRLSGTIAAAWAGRVVAVLLLAVAVLPSLLADRRPELYSVVVFALVSAFLWTGAGATLKSAQVQRRIPRADVRSLMTPAISVPADLSLDQALLRAAEAGVSDVVVVQGAHVVALLDPAAVDRVPVNRRGAVAVLQAARALAADAVIAADTSGVDVVALLRSRPAASYAVVQGRAVVGVLQARDVVDTVMDRPRHPGRTGTEPRS